MNHSIRNRFWKKNALVLVAFVLLMALISCNDSGTSPYAPSVAYKRATITVVKGSPMTPDSVVSDSGFVSNYSVKPNLPAGLSLNPTTGLISGTPTAKSASTLYTVTATGPNGTDKTTLTLGVVVVPPAMFDKGQARFEGICSGCHGMDAQGSQPEVHPGLGNIPPLANSDFLMNPAQRHRPIRIQFLGLPNLIDTATVIIVKGDTYQSSMPSIGGTDSEIASVLSYVRAVFNNADDYITVEEVAKMRDSLVADSTGVDPNHN